MWYVDERLLARLDALVKTNGIKRNSMITMMIEKYVYEEEQLLVKENVSTAANTTTDQACGVQDHAPVAQVVGGNASTPKPPQISPGMQLLLKRLDEKEKLVKESR